MAYLCPSEVDWEGSCIRSIGFFKIILHVAIQAVPTSTNISTYLLVMWPEKCNCAFQSLLLWSEQLAKLGEVRFAGTCQFNWDLSINNSMWNTELPLASSTGAIYLKKQQVQESLFHFWFVSQVAIFMLSSENWQMVLFGDLKQTRA